MEDMFGFGETQVEETTSPENQEQVTDLSGGQAVDSNGNPITDLNEVETGTEIEEKQTPADNTETETQTELVPGTEIEVDGAKYTVAENGDILNDKGEVFKAAADVKEWMKSFEVDETKNEDELNIQNIIKAVDIEIVDDDDKPIEFENTPNGIKSYIEAIIETSKQEVEEAAITTLFSKYPVLGDVLSYYVANGNSLDGFGEIKDRSSIQIDENNTTQQEEIIRLAWKERNQRGDVDSYIQYLKSTGALLATATEELEGLKEADIEYRKQLNEEAKAKETERQQQLQNYWTGVKQTIDNRKIAGYKIPESISVNRDGRKLSLTPNDFFNYLYRVDSKGYSQYQYDLMKDTPESRRDDEMLRAYLKFTGGSYSDLVNMAINEEKVKSLKLRAKENATKSTMKITKPVGSDKRKDFTDFGY